MTLQLNQGPSLELSADPSLLARNQSNVVDDGSTVVWLICVIDLHPTFF